ncbi:MAG: hypothetical protein K6E86_02800 [Bacteroidales bacterium]|nr:hypothetical protein [Bacteroidales bacterium]
MTIDNGDTRLADQIERLRGLVKLTMTRCQKAEDTVQSLRQQLEEQQTRIETLETANKELTDKYQGLRAGTAMGATTDEIQNLRDRYLAIIREIDLCLTRLNG